MFWANFGNMVVVSGNNYATLNDVTQVFNEMIPFRVDDSRHFVYIYAFAGVERLEKRVRMELEIE